MNITETIKDAYYRVCVDAENKIFQRIAFWTKASQVEVDHGNGEKSNLQQTVGAIKGITSDRNVTQTGYALDSVFASQICHIEEFVIPLSKWEGTDDSEYRWKAVFESNLYAPNSSPDWCLKTAGKFPTQAETESNNIIQIMEVARNNTTGKTEVIFYSTSKPAIEVTIQVKGI